jgi:hypothetical protein
MLMITDDDGIDGDAVILEQAGPRSQT